MNAKTVVYYDSELDGYLAAYAVKLSYGEHAKYVPLRPGEKPAGWRAKRPARLARTPVTPVTPREKPRVGHAKPRAN